MKYIFWNSGTGANLARAAMIVEGAAVAEVNMQEIDLTLLTCPMPLLRVKQWLRSAKINDTVRVRLADAGSRQDVPRFLRAQGHTVLNLSDSSVELMLEVTRQPGE
jgi:TusA-related sulfurtransferase